MTTTKPTTEPETQPDIDTAEAPPPGENRAAWREAVAAALPAYAYVETVGNDWKATWTTSFGIWTVSHGPNRSRTLVAKIDGPHTTAILQEAPSTAVIALLRTLGAVDRG